MSDIVLNAEPKRKVKLFITQSHTKTECSSFVMQMAAAAPACYRASWLCLTFQRRSLHLSLCLWITHLKFRWGSGESCWFSSSEQKLNNKSSFGLHRSVKVRYSSSSLDDTLAATGDKNEHDVIRYSKQMHAGDSSCCALWWQAYEPQSTESTILWVFPSITAQL